MSQKTLLLVDGSSYLYRAFHALPDLRGPAHEPTGAIHGIAAMMKRLREQVAAEHAVCVFDAKGRTFRDDWYAEYKATRSPMPSDLALQIEPIHELIRLMGWPILEVPGIEADDAIGTLACHGRQQGYDVVISTGDKDMAQLVNEHVTLINTMSNETLDTESVKLKFGVAPDRIIDYLTLVGDTVDNVPGVDKVGPKTAAKWLAEHGSLEGVMAAASSMKGVAGENLRRALEWLPLSRRLVTVKLDCDLSEYVPGWPAIESLNLKPVDKPALLAFYERHGFKTFKAELERAIAADAGAQPGQGSLPGMGGLPKGDDLRAGAFLPPLEPEAVPAAAALEKRYETIFDLPALERWIAKIEAAPLTAIDTETDSLEPMRARLVGISLSVEPGEAAYVPLRHDYPGAPDQLSLDLVLEKLRPWLENAQAAKLGHHVKYDTHVLENHGVKVRGYRHDTLLEGYVLEAHRLHSLENMALRHLGRKGLSYEDVCGKGASQIPFSQLDIEKAAEYSCEDSEMTLHLHQVLWPQIEAEPGLRRIYEEIEMPVAGVLQVIERHGVLIDAQQLARQSQQLAERMLALEKEAHELAGQAFNLGSPKQISEVLYTKLSMPVLKKTASGSPSTDEEVLEKLAADYPLPGRILEHRGLAKLKGTYTDKLPLMVLPATGRVHTNYGQAVAVTGRLASNDPNLQNIPIRTAEGRRVREAFVAPPGHVLLSADYSQIELRIMAHISGDENLLRAFTEGLDVHRATAGEIFGQPPEFVTSEQRRYAKVINFGLIYGMSAFGLASNLGIERAAATAYIERYFDRYPLVKRYMEETRAIAKARGYVETVFGRRLWLPEINSPNGPRRGASERAAINAPMQGTAADLIKLAMIEVQSLLEREQRASRMIMQVHDELVLEVPTSEVEWALAAIPAAMASVAQLKVPLVAEVGVGANWEEAH